MCFYHHYQHAIPPQWFRSWGVNVKPLEWDAERLDSVGNRVYVIQDRLLELANRRMLGKWGSRSGSVQIENLQQQQSTL